MSLGEHEREGWGFTSWMSVLGQEQTSLFCTEATKKEKADISFRYFLRSVISSQRRGKLMREIKSSFTVPKRNISSCPKQDSGSVLNVHQSFSVTLIKS